MTTTVTDVPVPTVRRDSLNSGQAFLQSWSDFDGGFINIALDDGNHVRLPGGYHQTMAPDTPVYPADVQINVSHP